MGVTATAIERPYEPSSHLYIPIAAVSPSDVSVVGNADGKLAFVLTILS